MNNLREIRLKNNVTQEEIAKYLNVHKSMVSRYEKGTRDIPLSIAVDIANYLKCTLDELANRKEN